MRASPVIVGDSTTQKSRSLLRTCDHRAEIFSGSGPPGSITWRRTEFWRRTRARSTTGWREQRQPLHTDSRNVDALRRLVYTARRATAGGPAGRMSEMVLPHELRAGDVVELAGSAWRVVHQPRTRAGVKSLEVALEHVAHRDEWLIGRLAPRGDARGRCPLQRLPVSGKCFQVLLATGGRPTMSYADL